MTTDSSSNPADVEERYTGGCLCGRVVYQVVGKPNHCGLCHCTNCKKWTGSGSGAWYAMFDTQNVRYIKGEDLVQTYADDATDSGGTLLRDSCPHCGSSLTLVASLRENLTAVMVGSINADVSEAWKPQMEIFCKARPKWLPDYEVTRYNTSPYASGV